MDLQVGQNARSLAFRRRHVVFPPCDDFFPGHPLRVKPVNRDEDVPDIGRYVVTSGGLGVVVLEVELVGID